RLGGERLRAEVALADALEGCELWAESIHAAPGDVFDVQEAIAIRVAGAIASEIELAEQRRARLAPFASLDAWSAYHLGCWHMYRFTAGDYEIAERCFERAIALDPTSSRALAGLSFVHWQRAFLEISTDRAAEVARALDLAVRSLDADPHDPLAHWAFGRARLLQGEVDDAVASLDVTTQLNPSFAVGQYTLGFAQMQAGDLDAGIERADRARRLSPYDPLAFAMIGLRAFSLGLRGEVAEAASQMACAIRQPHAHYHMVAMAAVCDVLDDRGEAARRDWGRLRALRPGYDARAFLRAFRLQRPVHVATVEKAFARLERLG
ncbi:MAG TPA: tetratricopeptide repeat protein, partial [Lysobacter sp.]